MKLGSFNESFPAVSLIAECKIDGIFVEFETIDFEFRKAHATEMKTCEEEKTSDTTSDTTSKTIIGSYVEAALASLQLNLKLTNIHLKFCHKIESSKNIAWVGVKLSSFSYNDLDVGASKNVNSAQQTTVINKKIEFSDIIVELGQESNQLKVALAEGRGQIFLRVFNHNCEASCKERELWNKEHGHLQRDVEVRLNHHLNISFDLMSLSTFQKVLIGFTSIHMTNTANTKLDDVSMFKQSSMMSNPHIMRTPNLDQEDLIALTGIMRQYREAYHMAEQNQLKGGILVPSNAYLDEEHCEEEIENEGTFDMFFDANDQSIYNTASILMESTHILQDNKNPDVALDQTHTKLQISLLSSRFKINFQEEYVLATFDDLSLSYASTYRTSELDVNVAHIQLDDAYIPTGDVLKIGSILGWSESDGFEETHTLVSEAPCLSIELKTKRNDKGADDSNCRVNLLPLELCLRQQTLNNISKFAAMASDELAVPSSQSYTSNKCDKKRKEIYLSFHCPSIGIYLPLAEVVSLLPFFERRGEISNVGITRDSSVGITFENTDFELKLQPQESTTQGQASLCSGKFRCLHMELFAIAPEGDIGYETQMLKKDIFIAGGRTEVNPSTPITFAFTRVSLTPGEENPGRNSFPIVPVISSFKARQEDDDESVTNEHTSNSMQDLRSNDPQITMLANAEKSTIIISAKIPDIILDLSTTELELFVAMLRSIQQSEKSLSQRAEKATERSHSQNAISEKVSIAVNLDKLTISIRDDKEETPRPDKRNTQNRIHSFILATDGIESHTFFDGSDMKHCRFFSHDFCLYCSNAKPRKFHSSGSRKTSIKDRLEVLKCVLQAYSKVSVVPILFRSQMFTPISQETPCILLDFIDLSGPTFIRKNKLLQRRIHLTVYHLTYRYDADSLWADRLLAIFSALKNEDKQDSVRELEPKKSSEEKTEASMTRLFVSFADINLDYKSPSYFETSSKSIIRIGDFRLSSNLMQPAGVKQSYNLSIGDVAYHLASDEIENQYRHEDSWLCRSSLITRCESSIGKRKLPSFGTMPESMLKELNFVNILSLDAMNAVVTHRTKETFSSYDCTKDPTVAISLTFGTLSLHACKDSFICFANSVGELQSKLIGLTDNDIEILKEKLPDSINESESIGRREKIYDESKLIEDRNLLQEIKIPTILENDSCATFLDGHEWTTVDKDILPRLSIPPGDEQVSGWYNINHNYSGESLPPSQIKQQHFPFHSTVDPLLEGDMGARILVEEKGDLSLKSQISIQKLTVKLRLFDGYDWPEKCSVAQRKAVMRSGKNFIIEPLPKCDQQKKQEMPEDRSSAATKARLMEELLNPDDNLFEEVPLPKEKALVIDHEKYLRVSRRRPDIFCQVSLNGITSRIDSYEQSESHRLQSIMEVHVSNLFVAETISDRKPIKMIGEWNNDYEHPRDTRFGTLMLNMATWRPTNKITNDNRIASEECNVSVQLLPMRCLLDQRTISFLKAFFNNEDTPCPNPKNETDKWHSRIHLPPPPTLKTFKIKPWKVKVDYYPTQIDVTALREGSIVELVNLSPIQRMVITLDEVVVLNSNGFGPVFSEVISSWIKEICGTQLHKFLANARPFEPFTDVGQGLTDLMILPYDAFMQGDSIHRAMKKGVKSLAETVVFQTLATTSGLTKMAAGLMADSLGLKGRNDTSDPLPPRPLSVPKGVGDARIHAARSLARGISAANYKVVVIPYREYLRNGMSGAVTSVIKGIPVLLVAPLSGATEAASYTLLGARNALRPELRKEEEASIL